MPVPRLAAFSDASAEKSLNFLKGNLGGDCPEAARRRVVAPDLPARMALHVGIVENVDVTGADRPVALGVGAAIDADDGHAASRRDVDRPRVAADEHAATVEQGREFADCGRRCAMNAVAQLRRHFGQRRLDERFLARPPRDQHATFVFARNPGGQPSIILGGPTLGFPAGARIK